MLISGLAAVASCVGFRQRACIYLHLLGGGAHTAAPHHCIVDAAARDEERQRIGLWSGFANVRSLANA